MAVDSGEVIQKVGEIIFDDIYGDPKFSYSKKYQFTFNKTNEIGVKVITANFDLVGGSSESELKLLSLY